MAERESKYAVRLRELGCTPFKERMAKENPGLTIQMEEGPVIDGVIPLSRQKRRRLVAEGRLPSFHSMPDMSSPTGKRVKLVIITEYGELWDGPLGIETTLVDLGFRDNSDRLVFHGPTVH